MNSIEKKQREAIIKFSLLCKMKEIQYQYLMKKLDLVSPIHKDEQIVSVENKDKITINIDLKGSLSDPDLEQNLASLISDCK